MFRLLLMNLLLFFGIWAAAQNKTSSLKELLSNSQKSESDTERIKHLLQLGNYYLTKQEIYQSDLDSALFFFNRAKAVSDSLRLVRWQNESLLNLGSYYMASGNITTGKSLFMKVIDFYKTNGDKEQEADTWSRLGKSIPGRDPVNIPEKIRSFEQSYSLFQSTHNKLKAIDVLKNIAESHLNEGKFYLAETELLQVLSKYKAFGFKTLKYTYDLLAETSKLSGDLNKELFYYLELVKSMEVDRDTSNINDYYFKLAATYADLGQYDKSREWALKSMEIIQKRADFQRIYMASGLIVYDLLAVDRPEQALIFLQRIIAERYPESMQQKIMMYESLGDCYAGLKQFIKAEQYYLKMVHFFEVYSKKDQNVSNYNNIIAITHFYKTIANFYIRSKQYQKAGYYTHKIFQLPKAAVKPLTLSKIHFMQFEIDSAQGNYLSALTHFTIYKKINDSLFSEAKSKQLSELQIKYETDRKELELNVLRSKERIQEQELKNSAQARKFISVLTVALIVLIGIGYSRYRLKKKSNNQLQAQQKEINHQNSLLKQLLSDQKKLVEQSEWLAKEIHHRVKNNLQIIISLLSTQSKLLDSQEAVEAIRESRNRMQAMSLIHQKLYQSENNAVVDMHDYIHGLVGQLDIGLNSGKKLLFDLKVDPIKLDISQAIPVGLILNEAITNAIKYAFPNRRGGRFALQ